jgi:DNA-binding transcriptional regulator YdaS (Cro superfamily)
MSSIDILKRLAALVDKAGSQVGAAKSLGVSASYLNDVIHARRAPGPKLLKALKLRSVTRYEAGA